jgi:hypothetical protein
MSASGPVARWLDIILCNPRSKQYMEVFRRNGIDTLHDVCSKLDVHSLMKMGVIQIDCEKILEQVSVLRQTPNLLQPSYHQHQHQQQQQQQMQQQHSHLHQHHHQQQMLHQGSYQQQQQQQQQLVEKYEQIKPIERKFTTALNFMAYSIQTLK